MGWTTAKLLSTPLPVIFVIIDLSRPNLQIHVTSFLSTGQDPQPSTQGDTAGPTEDSEIGDNVVSYCNTLGATPFLWVGFLL